MSRASVVVKGAVTAILEHILPPRTKRLMFLASLSARVKDVEEKQKEPAFDDATLQKLNQLMALSANDEALKLPVHLSRVIWRGKTLADICGEDLPTKQLTPDRVESISQTIVSGMPSYLKYDKAEEMVGQVKKLLLHHRIFTTS